MDVTIHDAVSFPRLNAYRLCQWHAHASNIPERATRTQRFGSSHSGQHKLKTATALGSLWPYLCACYGEYEPYAVPRAHSLAPVDYYRQPYTVPRVSMNPT